MTVPPPAFPSPEHAVRLRRMFQDAGYSAENLHANIAVRDFSASGDPRLQLAESLQDATPLHVFARWFLLGVPVTRRVAETALAGAVLTTLGECGMILAGDTEIVPAVTVTPFEGFLVASDTRRAITSGTQPDAVLFPNPTTEVLSRFAIRRSNSTVLELGTGCGAVALSMASDGRSIVATDINGRAVDFARFNVQWSGAQNVDVAAGDRFDPVPGRRFDAIVSNPPFFVSPPSDFAACENPFELDEFCRSMVRDAPRFLNEGGFLQILLEWVEVEGEPWEDRIRGWVDGPGCDLWLGKAYTKTPRDYADRRLQETTNRRDVDPEVLANWVAYLRARKVVKVHGGVLVMRRREGNNWVRFEEVDGFGSEPFGDSIVELFANIDILEGSGAAEELLDRRPRLSIHARLNVQYSPGGGNWQPVSLRLRLIEGVQRDVALDSAVASFLAGFDGSRTLRELVETFAAQMNASVEHVTPQCVTLAAKLIGKGVVLV